MKQDFLSVTEMLELCDDKYDFRRLGLEIAVTVSRAKPPSGYMYTFLSAAEIGLMSLLGFTVYVHEGRVYARPEDVDLMTIAARSLLNM